MSAFICPICKAILVADDKTLKCNAGHSFDVSKYGYVNLLISQKTGVHGDDKLMVAARTRFLSKGFYNSLLENLTTAVQKYFTPNGILLDAGCGECWYTSSIFHKLHTNNPHMTAIGIDISKEALKTGAKRCKDLHLAVASIYNIPVKDSSCDMVLNIFAPNVNNEFCRVLKAKGILIKVVPLEKHLWSLKQAIYDKPYLNKPDDPYIEGFNLLETIELREKISLSSNEEVEDLFKMTPYYYKTGKSDQLKLAEISSLDTELEFGILVYQKLS